ncbi:hypothetical protein B0H13DRAFT_1889956 [Mycena leptocephala]|jgi:hypothetical protein|nr:hypothetical protein B0H13DRAFT_1889956 [Mycena leptocephala]
MASADRSESVSQWKDTSKEVRQAFRNDLNIPEHIASTILPGDGISIHALMEFTLPRVTAQDVFETSTYFSLYSPAPAGFALTDDGSLIRHGAAEDSEVNVVIDDLPLAVRRPRRGEKKNTLYHADIWEEY